MLLRAALVLGLLGTVLGGCAQVRPYDGPQVTRVVVLKSQRQMLLMHHDEVLSAHRVDLGFSPEGHKITEGDGRTPEGRYQVNRRNPQSRYHLSLGIDYPRPRDVALARYQGVPPGGDIFIHGTPGRYRAEGDWTAGCVAVGNAEMERIYSMVPEGTAVDIYP